MINNYYSVQGFGKLLLANKKNNEFLFLARNNANIHYVVLENARLRDNIIIYDSVISDVRNLNVDLLSKSESLEDAIYYYNEFEKMLLVPGEKVYLKSLTGKKVVSSRYLGCEEDIFQFDNDRLYTDIKISRQNIHVVITYSK